ncbi:transporter [Sphingomonas pituitosa]|uniref:transporter n=1 Tax=Sphingomonas pituitosa TaxID=99597 RepID=UPI00082F449C|nr:transporter [Sphingomonas pituitosa]
MFRTLLSFASLTVAAAPAFAQDSVPAAPAAAAPAAPALCTDRPTKSNFACTVPEGMVQLETDMLNWTRSDSGDTRVDTILYTSPTLKYGLTRLTDIEASIAPYASARTRTATGTQTLHGVGDLTLRVKQRLSDPASTVQVALLPFVKIPTAKTGIGNGETEGGVIVPVNIALPRGFTLTFGPEGDILADSDGHGHHAQLVGTANLGKAITSKFTLIGEFWVARNFDPAAYVTQTSADIAATYLLRPTLQLDLGANFGLNQATPDAQVYLGVSTRF